MTNAERIRAMADEEPAVLLAEIAYSGKSPWEEPFEQLFCETCPAPEYILDDGRKLNMHECDFEGCEINPDYVKMAADRIAAEPERRHTWQT